MTGKDADWVKKIKKNRGQETITYLLHGSVDHEDFAGHKGTINAGDLQFMTAGRGIVHAEMPGKNHDGTPNVGLQLWVDLPKHLKMCEPRYRDLRGSEIPTTTADDGRVSIKIISGNSHGVDSLKDLAYTPVWLLDVTIQPGGKLVQPLPKGWNAFAYVLKGDSVIFGEATRVEQYYNVVFEQKGDGVEVMVPDNAVGEARFGMYSFFRGEGCFWGVVDADGWEQLLSPASLTITPSSSGARLWLRRRRRCSRPYSTTSQTPTVLSAHGTGSRRSGRRCSGHKQFVGGEGGYEACGDMVAVVSMRVVGWVKGVFLSHRRVGRFFHFFYAYARVFLCTSTIDKSRS